MRSEGFSQPLQPARQGIESLYRDAGIRSIEDIYSRDFFVKHLGKDKVERDEQRYERVRNQESYQIDKTEEGVFLETLFGRAHRMGPGFFGNEKVNLLKTHRHDDVFHAVDYVAELALPDGKHALFGFDVTTGDYTEKMEALSKRFSDGRLSDVDYYVDPDNAANVGIKNIPSFTLGVGKEDLEQFLRNVGGAVNPKGQAVIPRQLQQAEAALIAKMQGYFREQLAEQTRAYWSVLMQRGDSMMTRTAALELSRLIDAKKYREAHTYLLEHTKDTNPDKQEVRAFEKFLTVGMMGEKLVH